jgi:hypothetical protein
LLLASKNTLVVLTYITWISTKKRGGKKRQVLQEVDKKVTINTNCKISQPSMSFGVISRTRQSSISEANKLTYGRIQWLRGLRLGVCGHTLAGIAGLSCVSCR